MIEKFIFGAIGIAGLVAATVEANKLRTKFWDAQMRKNDKEWNEKVISFRDELPGLIRISFYQEPDRVKEITGFVWIKEFYDALSDITVWKREETILPSNRMVITLIKADDTTMDIVLGENRIILEDGTIYPVFGLKRLKKLLDEYV